MKIYTVSELTEAIKELLEGIYPEVWVSGEISNFTAHRSGHYYFNLKDESSRLKAVMFRGDNRGLRFRPEEGLAVTCYGRITVYPPRGNYQIVVQQMEPQGLGALQLAFEQLKKRLKAEGLFDDQHKKPLPYLPRKIGVITSISGAVLRDILHVASRRYPNMEILIHPVAVQGKEAAGEIVMALKRMNERDDIDILIVGRGGGSIEDLWAFNEEVVARAIFESRIPMISAIGHETDFTIADFVADLRAPTPSAAAELAVPLKKDLLEIVEQWKGRLRHGLVSLIQDKAEELRGWQDRLRDPRRRLEEWMQRVDELSQRMNRATVNRLQFLSVELKHLCANLLNLNPLSILKRGYCIALPEGSDCPMTSAEQIAVGEKLQLRLARGGLLTEVLQKSR